MNIFKSVLLITLVSVSLGSGFAAEVRASAPSHDYAAWATANPDGSWTRTAEQAVAATQLYTVVPDDIQQFCPSYAALPQQQRKQFWVGLLSAMAKPESNFRPQTSYQERFLDRQGKPVISRGLLQISIESANQQRYNCQIAEPKKLHDPKINLRCGAKILALWVKTDGIIAQPEDAKTPIGGGRYWSTLRASRGHLDDIAAFTRQLPFCEMS